MGRAVPTKGTRLVSGRVGIETVCATCGHRYAVHAGLPESACVKGDKKGRRCSCKEFKR